MVVSLRKLQRVLPLVLVLSLSAAGCGSDSTSSGKSDEPTAATAAPATTAAPAATAAPAGVPGLVEEGKLIVVTTGNFPPFTAIDPDSGEVVGYTIDIARSLAERLGLELETPTVDWVNELEGLAQGLYDIADSGIWPTAKRQESFLFSRPLISTGIVAQVRAEDAGGPGFADMTGMKTGGIQGSSQEAYMLENADALGYESYSGFAGAGEALTALKQGRVDALSQDTLVAGFASVNDPELAVAGPTVLAHPLSLAMQLGQEAKRDAVNAALDAMIADGTLAELQKKWFNTCIPVPDHNNQEEPYTTMPAGDCAPAATAVPAGVPGLVEEGKLIVVTTGNFPPFTAIDPDSGEVVGYTIDIARSLAERLGLELETPTVDWVNELEGLAQGLYDIADSGIWPTAKRQESFLFSRPLISTGIVAQVRAEDAGGPGFADMTGMKTGGIQGSSQEAYMLENADALGYESYSGFAGAGEALTALKQGRVDALSQDTLVAGFASVNDPELAVAGPTVLAHPLSLAMQLGQEAKRDAVNAALDAMIADGTLAELQKKWFNTCIPVPDHNNQEEPYTTMPAGDC